MRYTFSHNSILLFILLSTPLHAEDKQAAPSQTTLAKRAIQFTPADFTWVDAPRSMPAGTKIQVLEGNPTRAGLFTMRVKLPAQTTLMPHSHPQDERVTVLSGAAYVGFGDKLDLKLAKQYATGSYYVNPARLHHYVYFGEETVVQFTGMGPWEIDYLKPPEQPKKKKRAK
ncbi:MAG TPA: cupin domain-containing protein [Gammaproteobacteria bacterium]|nr:cupin domain-containing protein [Gammaproteobacteria bacterium]